MDDGNEAETVELQTLSLIADTVHSLYACNVIRPSRPSPIWLLSAVVGCILALSTTQLFFQRIECQVFDFFSRHTLHPKQFPDVIKVVLVDETAIREVNHFNQVKWPWPRHYQAGIAAWFYKAGARAVFFDFLFPEYSEKLEYDECFATYIRACPDAWLSVLSVQPPDQPLYPYPELKSAIGDRLAVVNDLKDLDGVIRRYPAQDPYHRLPYLPGALALARHYQLASKTALDEVPPGGMLLRWYGNEQTLHAYSLSVMALEGLRMIETIQHKGVEEEKLPLGFDGDDYVHVRQLLDRLPVPKGGEPFKDKVVLVGASAAATYDEKSTTISRNIPGVMTHATALANLIRGDYFRETPPYLLFGLVGLTPLVIVLLCQWTVKIRWQITWTVIYGLGIFLTSYILFLNSIWLPPFCAMLSTGVGFTVITTYNYFTESKLKRMYRQLFSDFVSEEVLNEILLKPGGLDLSGDTREGTVLFCDLAGFTTLTESATPKQLIASINSYLARSSEILMRRGAYVDKFIGDAVMAIFNIPKEDENTATNACLAALEMNTMISQLNAELAAEFPGLKLSLRTGINTGSMIAGPVGYARKLNYTVLGDAVNLASRLEGANKAYGTPIMIGPITEERVRGQVETRPLDLLQVKGKTKPVQVFEVMSPLGGLSEAQMRMREAYENGLQLLLKRQWTEAIASFDRALEQIPTDGPSRVHRERCLHYQSHPPSADWDGSFHLDTK